MNETVTTKYWYVVVLVKVIYIILVMKVLNMRDNKMCL